MAYPLCRQKEGGKDASKSTMQKVGQDASVREEVTMASRRHQLAIRHANGGSHKRQATKPRCPSNRSAKTRKRTVHNVSHSTSARKRASVVNEAGTTDDSCAHRRAWRPPGVDATIRSILPATTQMNQAGVDQNGAFCGCVTLDPHKTMCGHPYAHYQLSFSAPPSGHYGLPYQYHDHAGIFVGPFSDVNDPARAHEADKRTSAVKDLRHIKFALRQILVHWKGDAIFAPLDKWTEKAFVALLPKPRYKRFTRFLVRFLMETTECGVLSHEMSYIRTKVSQKKDAWLDLGRCVHILVNMDLLTVVTTGTAGEQLFRLNADKVLRNIGSNIQRRPASRRSKRTL